MCGREIKLIYYNLGHFNKDNGVVILPLLQVIISSSEASVGRLVAYHTTGCFSNVNTSALACKDVFFQSWVIDINVVNVINVMNYNELIYSYPQI